MRAEKALQADGVAPSVPHAPRFPADADALAETLTVLSYGARLEILNLLAHPVPLADIRVSPHRAGPEDPERPMSKQGVQAHLDKLVETGLARVEVREVGGRMLKCYVANAPRLYALVEDLRAMCARYTAHARADATGTLVGAPSSHASRGPRLVLVHGVYEGRAYPLHAPEGGPWLLGRSRSATVPLDYDPFVSAEHAEIVRDGEGFTLRDLPASKNGTSLNWEPLPRGGTARLAAGDIICIGRSLLSFRDA